MKHSEQSREMHGGRHVEHVRRAQTKPPDFQIFVRELLINDLGTLHWTTTGIAEERCTSKGRSDLNQLTRAKVVSFGGTTK
jgi:hypothetical protein